MRTPETEEMRDYIGARLNDCQRRIPTADDRLLAVIGSELHELNNLTDDLLDEEDEL